eukprot:CAMPEP_0202449246 /NCGR_PEP_ID=MMETSP1360-20130828/7993_1 /ASSEMBLY_ACC=CAM_ASM_000848 /TAXON_ID=515479 /ORGANISM="Licmophora paradoxa, Strain CCMP2313" /LENGTH=201 /DNA_ID=CAMNT_0049067109 /DNA_START=325 /DNA_END=929 /DNA_ORIENTATION=+
MIDVSFGKMEHYTRQNMYNIHSPNIRVCGRNGYTGSRADYMSSLFRIHHYSSGTVESFVERGSDRRAATPLSWERFLSRNVEPAIRDTDIRAWVPWFVDTVGGEQEARRLLVEPMKEAYDEMKQHPFLEKLRRSQGTTETETGHPEHLKYEGPPIIVGQKEKEEEEEKMSNTLLAVVMADCWIYEDLRRKVKDSLALTFFS